MPAPSNLVHESSSSTGTGNFTLNNVNGKRSFNTAFGTGGTDVFDYFISNRDAAEWERGTGHLSTSSTLVRDTVKESSNAGAAVSFSAGTKDVVNDVPAARQVYTDESGNVANAIASINGGQLAGNRNVINNGAMMIAQRGTSFTSSTAFTNDNAKYTLDQWKLFSGASAANANNVVSVAQNTADVPTNGFNCLTMTVVDNTKKFGICQFIEQKDCIGLIGNTVTLSFKAKVSSAAAGNLTNIKAAILSWAGTADAPTQPVSSSGWGSSGTTPTWATSWTAENTPANLSVTTSWVTYTITAAIDTASTKNIAIFIWSDAFNTTVGNVLYVTDVQLEIGSQATVFERRHIGQELLRCKRYLWLIGNTGAAYLFSLVGIKVSTVNDFLFFAPVEMRANPTLFSSSPTYNAGSPTGNQAALYNNWAGAYMTISGALTITTAGGTPTKTDLNIRLLAGTSWSGTDGSATNLYLGSTAYIGYTAEF